MENESFVYYKKKVKSDIRNFSFNSVKHRMVLIHTVVNVLMVLTVNIVITTSMIVPLLRVSMVVLVMIWCPISIVNVLQDLLVKNVKRISMSAFQCLVNQVGSFLHCYLFKLF